MAEPPAPLPTVAGFEDPVSQDPSHEFSASSPASVTQVNVESEPSSSLKPAVLSDILRELVRVGVANGENEPPGLAAAVDAASANPIGQERFWAACSHLFGISAGSRADREGYAEGSWISQSDEKVAQFRRDGLIEDLVVQAIISEEALRACPDCAALWGFGRLHGRFAPAPVNSLVAAVAQANNLHEPSTAYALSAKFGGSLGRLAWGELRLGGTMAVQHMADVLSDSTASWAIPPALFANAGELGDVSHCLEALDATMGVASEAMAHEHTVVPQPVDLDYLANMRRDDRQNYALADQLAAGGHADGIAAKAEMLFYGKDRVVPGGGRSSTTSSTASKVLTITSASLEDLASRFGLSTIGMVASVGLALMLVVAFCRRHRKWQVRKDSAQHAASSPETVARPPTSLDRGSARSIESVAPVKRLVGFLAILGMIFWIWLGSASVLLGALPRNADAAEKLFEEAATAGHWGSAYALAMIKLDGKNRSEATPWLRQVVKHGDDAARAMASHFQYRWGLGEMRDARRAGELLQEAAEFGDPNAALLLAEAHAHGATTNQTVQDDPIKADDEDLSTQDRVIPPGGPSLLAALKFYRVAASAGRLTSRFNIGLLLLRAHGNNPSNISEVVCREAHAEFATVATDLDPTTRLVFALAMRAWELGNSKGALVGFMLLSEVGSDKAHRNAARLWEAKQGHGFADLFRSSRGGVANAAQEQEAAVVEANPARRELKAEPGDFARPERADAPSEDMTEDTRPENDPRAATVGDVGGDSFQMLHNGRFCCPSGDCSNPQWLWNEGGSDPMDCAMRCKMEPRCGFMTIYATGYCQLSSSCEVSSVASDPSAQTVAFVRPAQALPPSPSEASCSTSDSSSCTLLAPPTAPFPLSSASDSAFPNSGPKWCWPFETPSPLEDRACAAAFHVRAANAGGDPNASVGSAASAGAVAAEVAALAAARHLEWLGFMQRAHEWSCLAAVRFSSEHGQLLCAALEAEAWEGHPRNITAAAEKLMSAWTRSNTEDKSGLTIRSTSIAAHVNLFGILGRCAVETVMAGCRVSSLGVRCNGLMSELAGWQLPPAWLPNLAIVEMVLTLGIVLLATIAVALLVCLAVAAAASRRGP
eukprot:TRINITY_DN33612_c0_g1_i1.p1 TRINITY_DN33612_c0_g1~~TRINITY_DN33612_c0_g1_i1.p1  ORF type:complete len:1111 (+),score=163.63 TRINITY_DN33612_c0_g1_i1:140-3472(+)